MPATATEPSAADLLHSGGREPVTLEPHPNLLRYYLLKALAFGPGFIFAVPPLYFRYRTLRYEIDDEGITMRWGILFRREISLTYARIQDIQLGSNVFERWLGLARIQLQTASGSSSAEMTIEGVPEVETMRDFLYSRMRGVRGSERSALPADVETPRRRAEAGAAGAAADFPAALPSAAVQGEDADDVAALTTALNAVAAELRALRLSLDGGDPRGGRHD